MRKNVLALAVVFMLGPALHAQQPKNTGNDDMDVKNVLLQHAHGFEIGDLHLIESVWSHSSDVRVFENGRINEGWEDFREHHLKPELGAMKNVKYTYPEMTTHVSGTVAWATFKYAISADAHEQHVDRGGIGTAVLEKGSDGWKIVHWHTSSPRTPPAAATKKQ